MMACSVCGAETRADDGFCRNCGATHRNLCRICGRPAAPADRFCAGCGAPLGGTTPSGTGASLGSFAIGEGERKLLTVLFVDLQDSTALIEGNDPEVALQKLSPLLDLMREAIHQYGGIVSDVLGDGVMAVFGAPKPFEDHAVRACLAALAMQERFARLDNAAIRIRVGIHTGEVVVKAMNASLTQKVGVIGTVVHLANRMEQMADPAAVFVTAETYQQARQYVDAVLVGERIAKGVLAPVHVYQVTGPRHAPASNIFRTRDRLLTLRGRDAALARLEEALEAAVRGDASIVGLVGEAGIGKSRLCYEFVERCRRREIAVLEARATPFGKATPLQAMLDLLRDYFRIRSIPDAAAARDLASDRLDQLGVDGETRSLILELLGLARSPGTKGDPSVRKERLTEFVRAIVRRGSDGAPAVVLVEDLHWLDPATEELLSAVADAVPGTRTMLLLTSRPETGHAWMSASHYQEIALDPLDNSDAEALISEALGDAPALAGLRYELADRARGNPFFLEELIRVVLEPRSGAARGGAQVNRLGLPPSLPPTIQGLLAARIDGLDRLAKNLLQIAAVIGREIPVPVMSDVADTPSTEFEQALGRLRQLELVYEMPRADKTRTLAFRHPLIQEVAYRSLLTDRRVAIHGAVAKSILVRFKERLDEQSALLAYHFEQAGNIPGAAQALARAAFWIGPNDPGQALATWRKANAILADQPRRADLDMLRMTACGQIVNFGWREGFTADDARPYFTEAARLAVAGGNLRANALIHAAYGRILAGAGSADEYVEKIREAQSLAAESSDASLRVTLNAVLCHALRLSGRLEQALAVNADALEHCHEVAQADRETLGFDVEPWLFGMRGQLLVTMGRGAEARPCLDRVIDMDPGRIDAVLHLIPSIAYVEWAWTLRDGLLARRQAERAMAIADHSGIPYLRVLAGWSQGVALAAEGAMAAAIDSLSETLAFARRQKVGLEYEARILADIACAALWMRDHDMARGRADEAIRIARDRRARVPEYFARLIRGATLTDAEAARHEQARAVGLLAITKAKIFAPLVSSPPGV